MNINKAKGIENKEIYKANYQILLSQATTQEEKDYISEVQKQNPTFAFEWQYVKKMKCEHYEIFQTPHEDSITMVVDEHRCTTCVCSLK